MGRCVFKLATGSLWGHKRVNFTLLPLLHLNICRLDRHSWDFLSCFVAVIETVQM